MAARCLTVRVWRGRELDVAIASGRIADIGPRLSPRGPMGTDDTSFTAYSEGLHRFHAGPNATPTLPTLPELMTRCKAPSDQLLSRRPGIQHGVAEAEIALAASRAQLARGGEAFEYIGQVALGLPAGTS